MAISSLDSGSLDSLVNLGIEKDRYGNVTINETKLRSVIESDGENVNAFLTGDNGFVSRTIDMVNSYASIAGGSLYNRQDDISSSMEQLTDQQLEIQDDIERFRTRLIRQFAAMEQTISEYNAIGDFLASQEARDTKND